MFELSFPVMVRAVNNSDFKGPIFMGNNTEIPRTRTKLEMSIFTWGDRQKNWLVSVYAQWFKSTHCYIISIRGIRHLWEDILQNVTQNSLVNNFASVVNTSLAEKQIKWQTAPNAMTWLRLVQIDLVKAHCGFRTSHESRECLIEAYLQTIRIIMTLMWLTTICN